MGFHLVPGLVTLCWNNWGEFGGKKKDWADKNVEPAEMAAESFFDSCDYHLFRRTHLHQLVRDTHRKPCCLTYVG